MEIDKSDGLFRKKLENYTEAPPPEVWKRIELSLNDKKRRRVIPLWITIGGVAAILLIGLMLFGPQNTSFRKTQNSISDTEANPQKTESVNPKATGDPKENLKINIEENQIQITQNSRGIASQNKRQEKESIAKSSFKETRTSTETEEDLASAHIKSPEAARETSPNNSVPPNFKGDEVTTINDPEKENTINRFGENETLEDAAEAKKNKWSVGPQVAPVYYGWVGNGSPIAQSFAGNSKSGLTNLSYGLSVSYALSPKVSIRSGINKVELGYQTNDVAFTSSFVSRPSSLIRTINYSENSKNVVVHSTSSNSAAAPNTTVSDLLVPSPEREGQMVQQFGYIEVPLELQLALVEKKWGLNLIGGMSSLFLLNNIVSLDAEGNSLEIGQASNMNNLNFSSNVGLGAYYKLNPDIEFTVQPMLKWHLNAFSETSGQFRPYTMGVYSGLSFRF